MFLFQGFNVKDTFIRIKGRGITKFKHKVQRETIILIKKSCATLLFPSLTELLRLETKMEGQKNLRCFKKEEIVSSYPEGQNRSERASSLIEPLPTFGVPGGKQRVQIPYEKTNKNKRKEKEKAAYTRGRRNSNKCTHQFLNQPCP